MEKFIQQIPQYFENELSEADEIAFEEAIMQSTELKKQVDKYRAFLQVMDSIESHQQAKEVGYVSRQNFENDLKSEIIEPHILPTTPKTNNRKWLWLMVVGFLGIVLFILWYNSSPTKPTGRQEKPKTTPQDTLQKAPIAIPQDTLKPLKKDTLPTPRRQDTKPIPPLPTRVDTIPKPENFISQAPSFESQAETGSIVKGTNFKIISPLKNSNLAYKATFTWENDNTQGIYKITIYDRYGEKYKVFDNIKPTVPQTILEINLSGFEPALYYWKLENPAEELLYISKFFVRKPAKPIDKPIQDKQPEVIAYNFTPNSDLDSKIENSKSPLQTIRVSSPAIDQNFTSKVQFDLTDSAPETQASYTLEILNNAEKDILSKQFSLKELPFEVDFSKNPRGLYYWRLRKNGVQVYVGRFLFGK